MLLFLCAGFIFTASIFAVNQESDSQEKESIGKVIREALVDGYLNEYDLQKMQEGIHPELSIVELHNNELSRRGYPELVEYVRRVKPDRPEGRRVRVNIKILNVDIVGDIGCAKVEFYVGSELHGTDFITLMRFADGWKLIGSVAYEHE